MYCRISIPVIVLKACVRNPFLYGFTGYLANGSSKSNFMRKRETPTSETLKQVLSMPGFPELQHLRSNELIDLFIAVSKRFAASIKSGARIEEIEALQTQITTIHQEIHRKAR
jgi:hypothetical protein